MIHLHVHTEHSQLDGLGKPEQYIQRAKELGMPVIAITDHGNVDGAIKWQKACKKAEIKSVIGCEMYIVPNLKVKQKGEKRGHVTLLVKNQEGWGALLKMLTIANLEGFYGRPRIDYDILYDNLVNDGMILLTGCGSSFLTLPGGQDLLLDIYDDGVCDCYLEVMPHCIPIQREINEICLKLSKENGIPLVATNDCHYILSDQWKAQEVLLAIQRKAKWNDPKRWKFGFTGLHLRTVTEMAAEFNSQDILSRRQYILAITNTYKIAEQCWDFQIPQKLPDLPKTKFEKSDPITGEVSSPSELLDFFCRSGFFEGAEKAKWNDAYEERYKFELEIIKNKDFSRYFLIIYELVEWCKQNKISIGPGRGSVGGSLIAFLLGITQIDPLKYGLLFERFISMDRIDLPDIDLDFDRNKVDLIRKHLEEEYGEYNIAGISTFLSMQAKAVIRDVGRVFDLPPKEIDNFSKSINYKSAKENFVLNSKKTKEGKDFFEKYPEQFQLMCDLEGQIRGGGQHPAGLIISKQDLRTSDRCNLISKDGVKIINWDMFDSEYTGLIKIDVLKLGTLSVLNEITRLIKNDFCFEDLDFDDPSVFESISKNGTAGIFQLTGYDCTKLCAEYKIEDLNDIAVIISIARPGPKECLPADTKIRTWRGNEIRLDDIDTGRSLCSSMFPENGKHRFIKNKIKAITFTGIKNIYEVKTEDKKMIRCSDKHKFYCPKKGQWQELINIKIGDYVLTRNLNPTNKKGSLHNKKMIESGKKTNFKKGNIPWNKGIKNCHDYKPRQGKRISSRILQQIDEKHSDTLKNNLVVNKKMILHLKKISENRWDKEEKTKHSETMINHYKENPHPNTKGINISKPQQELFDIIKRYFDDAILEFPFLYKDENNLERFFHLDIAIPDKKINIEYDGDYWHKNPGQREEPRDTIIEKKGWIVLRITEKNKEEFCRYLPKITKSNNLKHSKIKSIKFVGREKTYDVEMEDQNFPNFVANDFVVHNSGMMEQYVQRKKGQKWEAIHPIYERITKDTYGVMVYQEQMMKAMTDLAGFSNSDADRIRKIIGKKRDPKEFEPFREMFLKGCQEKKTIDEQQADIFWQGLIEWAGYGFNKAHAIEYAMIAYWTAWAKHYHFPEFVCASLTYGDEEDKPDLIKDAQQKGIQVVTPKIGISDAIKWIIKDQKLYMPFIEIKGLGEIEAKNCLTLRPIRQGFYTIKQNTATDTRNKTRLILTEIKAFDPDPMARPENCSQYFQFDIGDNNSQQPKIEIIRKQAIIDKKALNCASCDLRKQAYQVVLSSGGIYNVMALAEAPGKNEDRDGKGLIGDAGDLLWKELKRYEIIRRMIHVGNCCKCYPSQRTPSKTPSKQEAGLCFNKWMIHEIKSMDCKLVLGLGGVTYYVLTGRDKGITKASGHIEWVDKIQANVVWCVHPSYVLRSRSTENIRLFEEGIRVFAEEFEKERK